MLQNLELLKQLKNDLQESAPRIEGQIKATEKSYGFLETDKGKSYFVPPPEMRKVLHGDRVQARLVSNDGKESAELESLSESALIRFIGRVCFFKNKLQVMPEHHLLNRALNASIQAPLTKDQFNEGDWVVALLEKHALRDGKFQTEIIQRIASSDDKNLPWLISLARHKLSADAPVTETPFELQPESLARLDLTDLPLVTIDSPSTRDMDDAIHAEANANGWRLTVAIADPSAYVAADSDVDQIAKERGYTTYLPGRNIPMLPRTLSDELCSLQPNEKRPALCCQIQINQAGTPEGEPEFFTAWISSKAKLSYDEVSNWLELDEPLQQTAETSALIEAPLKALGDIAQASLKWRTENAVVFKDRPDYRFKLDSDGQVTAIFAEQRRSAHKLVEETMILANISAARFLSSHNTGIYNTHIGFEPEKIADVVTIANEQGYKTDAETLGSLSGYAAFRRTLISAGNDWLDARLRRFQGYVHTRTQPAPHYGMGLEGYATWTSPIRKYSDMVNHRLIKQILSGEAPQQPDEAIGELMDQQRQSSRLAERDTCHWLYTRFLKPAVEEATVFDGEIFDISRGGMRVRLLENGAAPFIPGSMIHKDRKAMTMDNNSGQVIIEGVTRYRLGDQVKVQLIKVDEERRSLIARPIQEETTKPKD
ncbi:exoribonuclease II [Oceanospirillum linum]|uniref:Exoribonuclease II n=1 Tax=Oceanospirillum linum TaxID=966 RepID=A0A1T1HCH1_OCELI|nr:exoribonuclease II [Oceanospirillum linum]OOV87496.1 exoribonuclease II [Oceanospirillum linum]SEF89820.1 exoribonuclease-2 [Oleiphilus messinensis]SMP13551.1 exoribonuclease-2 [Oceanospirillum linum]